ETGGSDDNPCQQNAGVDQLLHGVIAAKITMAEPASECCTKIVHQLGWAYRQKPLPEMASHQSGCHVHSAIDEKQPHGREMPEQPAGEPAAERDRFRKGKAKQRRGIVDLPTRTDHDQRGHGIDPMRDTNIARMDVAMRRSRGGSHINAHPMVYSSAVRRRILSLNRVD